MRVSKYQIARRMVELRKKQEAARDKIGGIAVLSFGVIMALLVVASP